MSTATITSDTTQPACCREPKPHHRLSTSQLDMADSAIKVAAGCAAFCINPVQTVNGALCGAAVRLVVGDNSKAESEKANRANLTASICFTALSATYALAVPGPHSAVPVVLGFSAIANGAYCLARKFVG